MSNKKISDNDLVSAKRMYMAYATPSEISKELGIVRTSIYHHLRKWDQERDLSRVEDIANMIPKKKVQFSRISSASVEALTRCVEFMANRPIPPNVQEGKALAAIIEALDKITRLDDNKPTDIISSEAPITIEDLQVKLNLNPFARKKDIEIIEETKEIE